MTSTSTAPRRSATAIVVSFCLFLAACGSGGPDLASVINGSSRVTGTSTTTALGIDGGVGADATWSATGTPAQVADSFAGVEPPDERTDDASGDVFLLYGSGTIWVTPIETGSAVVLYGDNDQAYSRHNGILIRNSSWGTRVNNYRSSGGSSSSNGFRGGGSSSGK